MLEDRARCEKAEEGEGSREEGDNYVEESSPVILNI